MYENSTINCSFDYLSLSFTQPACPAGYDEVATQFNETLELYDTLLRQINSTLATRLNDSGSGAGSGEQDNLISPELLQQLQNYQAMLEQLLERAINATER
jgi:hypothetical protein